MKQQKKVINELIKFYSDKALAFFIKNMKKKHRLDLTESRQMIRICINIAELYRTSGEESKALMYLKNAVYIGKMVDPNSLLLAFAFNNMGRIYKSQGKLDDALNNYQECLLIEEGLIKDNSVIAISYRDIAEVLISQGKSEEARLAFNLANLLDQ